jgi:diguanylate cyclase (GGDEF)-like protein
MTVITRTGVRRTTRADDIGLKVLLIEDQRSLAQMAAKMLYERWGCQVLIAVSLAQVRTILAEGKHQFFVALSDLNLPDAQHGEVIDVLIAAKLRVIAITGMFDVAMHDRIMSQGVVDYVLKDSMNAYEYIVDLVGRLYRNLRTRVLVVDDTKTFSDLIAGMLQIQGLQVITACDGVEALEILARQPDIKLVLTDHEMPRMDGFNFLMNVRRKYARDRLAVIGMSGAANSRLSAQFLKLGANDFISKPFSYEELICRVSQNLEMQESLESVRYIAYHDFLTGLLNRRAFFDQGIKLFVETAGADKPLAAAVMDIDFFKKINDSQGHDGGDVVLKHFAVLLAEHFKTDLAGRVGGEEFFLLSTDAEKFVERCEAFRLIVEQSPVKFNNTLLAFTISIGITCQRYPCLDDMLKRADENLYQAKESGRNRIVLM